MYNMEMDLLYHHLSIRHCFQLGSIGFGLYDLLPEVDESKVIVALTCSCL